MAVRPPQGSDDPEHIEFGIAALDARLDDADVQFPATADEVCRAVDDTAVPYDAAGNTLDLREALDRVPDRQFDTKTELLDRLHPVFEEARAEAAGSILGRLRMLLPF